ncbi:MAG: GGDEF domain-containing protein [Burkholderiaceae bacterium]|nr:GGDEF domain-containing protein [Burkholderiaceae bacterium]
MDLRTLFLAQTCALAAMATMFWVARTGADRGNGLRTWTLGVTAQSLAFLLLANAGRLPTWASAGLGNALGAVGVALYFVAIRQFLGRRYGTPWLLAMIAVVTAVGAVTGSQYAVATIFNGFVYGLLQLLNGLALWQRPQAELQRVQRVVAACYVLMGLVLPLRAAGLLLAGTHIDYLNMPLAWQEPIYIFGFLFVIVTNLGFLQLCKMRAEAEVRQQAMTDGLTGLSNRRALNDAMAHALAMAQRSHQPYAVLMADVDHFKSINDQQGHRAGDEALAAFAQRLRAALRAQDLPFRYGGEEFCVLLPDTDAAGVAVLAERLRLAVAQAASGTLQAISASFGATVWQPGDTADALLSRADRALYRAKALGRDRVEIELT